MKKIKIYGQSGCSKCSNVKKKIEDVVSEENKEKEIEVEKVEDMAEIAKKGIMSTPAVSINEEVVIRGSSPKKEELKEILF